MTHRFHPNRLPAGSVHHYLDDNHRSARLLVGCRLGSVMRLLDTPPEGEPRFDWGPALLTGVEGARWRIDADEGKANILIRQAGAGDEFDTRGHRHALKTPIAEHTPDHPLRRLLDLPIASVDVIDRDPWPGVPDSFAMCGLRLTTTDGARFCVGTHLTDLMIPGVEFRTPDEVDPLLRYAPL